MPNKYPEKKGWDVPKQQYKVTNWPEYNAALCRRGEIDVWAWFTFMIFLKTNEQGQFFQKKWIKERQAKLK